METTEREYIQNGTSMRYILLLAVMALTGSTALAGDITGTVFFRGTAIKPMRLMMNADPRCLAQQKGPVYSEDVVINPNGTLKNVLVSVKQGLPNRKFEVPSEKVVLDQKGCRYVPHVVGMMTGQELEVVNDDPTLHNVHSVSKVNPAFNVAQPKKGMHLTKTFDQPETFKVKCEVHPWMSAYVGVFPHPFFAVTGEDGAFTIKNLPPGDYTIEAWHERYGSRTATVHVTSAGPATADITFETK